MTLISESVDRVFGHLVVELSIEDESVRARFLSKQGPRFFEVILRGREYYEVPFIVSRICGACSIAHFLASIYALENAMNVEVTEDIKLLRDLANQIQIAQNNLVHLLFLALPDYVGASSFDSLVKSNYEIVRDGMKLNSLCLKVVNMLIGRIVNPLSCNVGGFYKDLNRSRLRRIIDLLKEAEKLTKKLVDYIFQLELPELEEKTHTYAVLESPRDYLVKGDDIVLSDGSRVPVKDYSKVFSEQCVKGSTSRVVLRNGGAVYVGPRARLNAYYERLREYREYLSVLSPPMKNPFMNIKAKALELLYIIGNVKEKIYELQDRTLKLRVSVKPRRGEGVGAIEAPRGLLIHHYVVNEDGKITYANIITPTIFNAKHLEECAEVLAIRAIKSGKIDVEFLRKLLSMLVRAYDPCLPCATHVVMVRG